MKDGSIAIARFEAEVYRPMKEDVTSPVTNVWICRVIEGFMHSEKVLSRMSVDPARIVIDFGPNPIPFPNPRIDLDGRDYVDVSHPTPLHMRSPLFYQPKELLYNVDPSLGEVGWWVHAVATKPIAVSLVFPHSVWKTKWKRMCSIQALLPPGEELPPEDRLRLQ
jgi:hypothetical protein